MSLVPALQRTDSNQESSQTSKRISSVYQQDGQPLSKEALYRYKLKYNNFNVGNNQEDEQDIKANRARSGSIAAKLAVKNVSEKKVNDSLDEAHKASPEEQYKRLLVQPDASLLAATKSHKFSTKKSSPSLETTNKVSRNNSTLFSHEKLASAANQASKNREYSITSNGKLNTSDASKRKLDLSRLKNVATEDNLINESSTNKKFNLSKLIPQATKNAETLEAQKTISNIPIPIQGLKTKNEFDPLVSSKYEIDTLTQLASKLADERIKDSFKSYKGGKHGEKALFTNEEWNKLAVQAVMERKQEILDDLKSKQSSYEQLADPKSVKVGETGRIYKLGDIGTENNPDSLIVLGNGLTLTQGEVTKLANKLMLPLLTQIDSDTKRQLITQAEIDEDKRTFKVETKHYKEDSRVQEKREKARESYEKKIQRQEDKIVSKDEKLQQKGFKVDMSDVLLDIQNHNNDIKSNLKKIDVLSIDQVKQETAIKQLKTGIDEVEQNLKSLKDEVEHLQKSNEDSGISAKDVQKNKYSLQVLNSKILKHKSQRSSLLSSLALEKSKLEDLSQKIILHQTSNDHLQSAIDIDLDKFEHLQELGKADKERSTLLNNLKRENQINLRSKAIFIRSSFNKNLDDIIAKVKAEDEADLTQAENLNVDEASARREHKSLYDTVNKEIKERKEDKHIPMDLDEEYKDFEPDNEVEGTEEKADDNEENSLENEEADVESELSPPQQQEGHLKEILN
ncbi:uncharacterized protein HGUI_00052 [Hanseniaspora guilliermondii]|uniref:Uncharacterized protein n=1 Tax=Hanseniaspora guilliermondii TaxID=56406 RepID=A0A1L0AVZ8_9ASCO|nr:uncharacterized protein HGUI_00052 [Hanseniaspora guilliermondii]